MRDMAALVGVVVVIAAVGAIAYFGFRPAPGGMPMSSPNTQAKQAASTPEKPEGKKQKRTEQNRAGILSVRAEAEESTTAMPAAPIMVLDVPNLAPPFPLPRDIPRGASRSRLSSEFGPPQLRVSGTSRGQFSEKYVYIKPDRSAITIAYLENGAVVSAESMPQ